ncbi:alanine racemase [Alkalibaculum sp. M08DMB]|uniref:Alanine racemase n=1 Tax=Alkalibaculum sporogenes TaxID=2655001 RepID=A0A6A7K7C4_9FIRM|nr:alanine racemase [Alkalibaculum sporogenes]
MRPTWCEIDLDKLIDNYTAIKNHVGQQVELMPVVKADAYGHGAIQCARALMDIGANRFAVAIVDEGIQLRKAGITCPILVLGYIPLEEISNLIKWDLTPTVYTIEFAKKLSDKTNKNQKIHIKLDTGMGRLGFRGFKETISAVETINKLDNINIEGIYSHFAISDALDKSYSYGQIEVFEEVIRELKKRGIEIPLKHFSNSAGIIDLPTSHYNCVRPGIILYGLYPSQEVQKNNIDLKPVKNFKTRISNLNTIHTNESVGYGRKYVANNERVIATLAVGYADGYSRLLSNKGEVILRGQRANVVGTICMDQCMIDVTHIKDVKIGDEVLLYGENLPIEEIAQKMGTINYEVTCMTKERVLKLYYWKNILIKLDNFLIE